MPFHELKTQLSQELARTFANPELPAEWFEREFGTPPQANMGHLALPCFKLSKIFRKASGEIAKEIAEKFQVPGITAVAAGPYTNFRWDVGTLYQRIVGDIFKKGEDFGKDTSGADKSVVIEYCSPNIAKKLGFQHIRSTLIGNVLANIYKSLGYKVVRMNFVGDWGAQFARLFAAVEQWGDKSILSSGDRSASMDHLFQLYVRFHKEVETDASYQELASRSLQKLEAQEKTAVELWRLIREVSLYSVDQTLRRLSVEFDAIEGESDYIPGMDKTLAHIKQEAKAKLSDGAWIVEVPDISTPALVQKKDGTTLYLTRDIAAAIHREKSYHFDKMLYVVSEQQKLHFQLLFGVLKLMGYTWAEKLQHVSFGTVLFGAEKMSTREGRVIFLDELLNDAKNLALQEVSAKNPNLVNKEEVAEFVGTGAVIFGNLSSHRMTDIEFEWKKVIALDGETGPYVQYACVRCNSLMEKAKEKSEGPKYQDLAGAYEFALEEEVLILTLGKFRTVLHQAVNENEPFYLSHYLIDVAKAFNRFYNKLPVLQATSDSQRQLRLNLVAATRQVLLSGLKLMGIRCPPEM